jgi:hypothetical protein
MKPTDSTLSTRRWLKVGLTIGGALSGAVFGIMLTRLGEIAAGAPPATLANYAWNAAVFGVMSGLISPLVSWAALRRVPLWRTFAEPLAYAVAGGTAAVILGAPLLLLVLPPLGLAAGFARLARRHRAPVPVLASGPANER